jgi:thiol-disulfide isomerase/thioredoxin
LEHFPLLAKLGRVHSLFLLAAISSACSPLTEFFSSPAPEVGAQAPDFTLDDLSGKPINLSDLRGQPVLLNFWATWCGPCRVEMPIIQESYNDGGFAVLAVNFDESRDNILPFVEDLKLSFPILLDPGGRIQELYRVRGYPTSVYIDVEGVIQFIHIGEVSTGDIEYYLSQLGVRQ